jgi:hypothetical protein
VDDDGCAAIAVAPLDISSERAFQSRIAAHAVYPVSRSSAAPALRPPPGASSVVRWETAPLLAEAFERWARAARPPGGRHDAETAFRERLRDGALIAAGFAEPVAPAAPLVAIPPEAWLVLAPDIRQSKASGGGRTYIAVRAVERPVGPDMTTAEAIQHVATKSRWATGRDPLDVSGAALREFEAAARDGRIRVRGRRIPEGELEPIERAFWAAAGLDPESHLPPGAGTAVWPTRTTTAAGRSYEDLRVSRAAVLRAWPPVRPDRHPRPGRPSTAHLTGTLVATAGLALLIRVAPALLWGVLAVSFSMALFGVHI